MSRHQILNPALGRQVMPKACALGIMTKAPKAGNVKTRLIPPLTAEEAAELNICFLHDLGQSIFQASRQSPGQGVGVYTPPGAEAAYQGVLPDGFFLMPQRGDNFGERLLFAAEDLFKAGFEFICLINSDSPTVPASSFANAANELAKAGDRIVLGPSDDGGYYLIGLKQMHRRMFAEIDWSTARVLEQSRQRAAEIGVAVHDLPSGFDVDDPGTLARLCEELFGRDTRLRKGLAMETRKFLSEILKREGRDRIWPT
jgi:uncharacterized protein